MSACNLRSDIGIVGQDPYIFDATLLENLQYPYYGLEAEANYDEMHEAIAIADIDGLAQVLSSGYDTPVGAEAFDILQKGTSATSS